MTTNHWWQQLSLRENNQTLGGPAIRTHLTQKRASQVALVVKNLPANAGDIRDVGLTPGLGKSPGGGHSNPL